MKSPCDSCKNRLPEGRCWRFGSSTGFFGRVISLMLGCEGYREDRSGGAETAKGSCTSSNNKINRLSSETDASSGTPPGSRKNKKIPNAAVHPDKTDSLWIVIGLTMIGAIFRFVNLDTNSLWLDEAATSFFSTPPVLKIWESTVAGEFNPPLFYVLEHFMIGMYGNTEMVLRFLPAVFGVLAIPVFYFVGKEFKDEITGIIMAVLCTVSPFLIWYSQEARAYTLLLLLVAGSVYFFLRANRTNTFGDWILFSALGAVAFWVHFYAAVIVFAMFTYAVFSIILQKKYTEKNTRLNLGLSICIYILIIYPLLLQMGSLWAKRTASAPTYGIQGIQLISETMKQLSGFSDLTLTLFFTIFTIGVIWMCIINRQKGIFLIWIFVVTFIASVAASTIIPMLPRYLIFMSVFLFLGIAASYDWFTVWTGVSKRRVLIIFSVIAILVSAPFLSGYYSQQTKEDWRVVAKELERITSPGDTVVTAPTYLDLPLGYYYSSFSDGTNVQGSITAEGLELIKQNANGTVWYIVTGDIMAADPTGIELAWLHANTQIKKQFPFGVVILKGI